MVEGRSAALEAFAQALVAHRGRTERIELISMDMSPAYQAERAASFREPRSSSIAFILCKWLAKLSLGSVRNCPAKEQI
jgi:transposase